MLLVELARGTDLRGAFDAALRDVNGLIESTASDRCHQSTSVAVTGGDHERGTAGMMDAAGGAVAGVGVAVVAWTIPLRYASRSSE